VLGLKACATTPGIIAVITALDHIPEEFDLYTNSKYVVHLFPDIETAVISGSSKIISLLLLLQNIIQSRKRQIFIGHIRGHTDLPGLLASGDSMADLLTKEQVTASMAEQALESHALHHQNALALRRMT
jgi:ribonuclease HI